MGLYLIVRPNGGKRKTLSMGTYPDVTLKEARAKRVEARRQLSAGINPSDKRKASRVAIEGSFQFVATEWHAKNKPVWAVAHANTALQQVDVTGM